jgi:hypothetical protein
MLSEILAILPLASAPLFVGAAYFIVTLDRQRANSPSKDDTQVGIKLVLWAFTIAGLGMAVVAIDQLFTFAFGLFKGGSMGIRRVLAPLLVGAGTAILMRLVLIPKTNNTTMKQIERYALGFIALIYGMQGLFWLTMMLNNIFAAPSFSWNAISGPLAHSIVNGAIGFLAIILLGSKSEWTGPTPPQRMQPPQGGGYPPQAGGQGYPPQGGGYPQGGGGYPQGGGGYPQGGGGGYPQAGGGGYPQGGGGGYPPQGGGGGYPPQA